MNLHLVLLLTTFGISACRAYRCYECDSTSEANCIDFSPKGSFFKAAYCDEQHTGENNCFTVSLTDRFEKRVLRGCNKAGTCERFHDQLQRDQEIHYCNECDEDFCNSATLQCVSAVTLLCLALLVINA